MHRNEKNKQWSCMIPARYLFGGLIILCSLGLAMAGTTWQEKQKLIAPDGAVNDRLASSVSMSGDYAILGAPFDNDKGDKSGSAYIFKRDGDTWSQQAKILAADGEIHDQFGTSVSICGDLVIVGAFHDSNMTGSAYIFKRDGTKWIQQAKLTASDKAADDWFGYSVSISGDYAILTAPFDDDKGISSGSAYIFKRDGEKWSQQAKLVPSDGAAYDNFGYSTISICGDLAIVGVPYDDDKGEESGSAYIFKRDGEKWSQQAKLLAADGTAGNRFGWSVSIGKNLAFAGVPYDEDRGYRSGSAYVFKWDGKKWSQQQKIIPVDTDTGDYLGNHVSVSGDLAIIGAPHLYPAGGAYIFKSDGKNWSQQAKLIPSDGAPTDLFGWSAAIDSDAVIVGSLADDDNGNDSGSAYIYKCEQTPEEQSPKEQKPKEQETKEQASKEQVPAQEKQAPK